MSAGRALAEGHHETCGWPLPLLAPLSRMPKLAHRTQSPEPADAPAGPPDAGLRASCCSSGASFQSVLPRSSFIIAALTDWYDGWIARKTGDTSRDGGSSLIRWPTRSSRRRRCCPTSPSGSSMAGWSGLSLCAISSSPDCGLRGIQRPADRDLPGGAGKDLRTVRRHLLYPDPLCRHDASPAIQPSFGSRIDDLMDPQVLFGMMLLVTLVSVGTAVAYLFDNSKLLRELYGSIRPGASRPASRDGSARRSGCAA